MDAHVPRSVMVELRRRGLDVLTAQEDGMGAAPDRELLDRATALGRVLFSQDDDLLVEAVRRQRSGVAFTGVVYGHQLRVSIGRCIQDLELIAVAAGAEEVRGAVIYLPL